jgi:arylformamidase
MASPNPIICFSEFQIPRRICDLSPTITPDLPVRLLGHQALAAFGFSDTTEFRHQILENPLYIMNSYITLFDHAGAHADAPMHVIKGGKSIDQLPLERFFGAARVLDFRCRSRDSALLAEDFASAGITPGEIVIIAVGYEPPTGPNELPSYAYLSGEAAEFLATIPVRAVATDMPSLGSFRRYPELMAEDPSPEHVVPEHMAFLSREIPIIESLVRLEQIIGESKVVFAGFPLKVQGAGGGQIRAAALVY